MNVLLIAGDRRWQCWALTRSGVTSLLFRAVFPCFSVLESPSPRRWAQAAGMRLQGCQGSWPGSSGEL